MMRHLACVGLTLAVLALLRLLLRAAFTAVVEGHQW